MMVPSQMVLLVNKTQEAYGTVARSGRGGGFGSIGPGVIYRDTNIPTNTTVHSNGTRPTLYITE